MTVFYSWFLVLYKEGPASYHASYVVIIDVVDKETLKRDTGMCRRCMNPKNIFGLNRLCETTGKVSRYLLFVIPKAISFYYRICYFFKYCGHEN